MFFSEIIPQNWSVSEETVPSLCVHIYTLDIACVSSELIGLMEKLCCLGQLSDKGV